MRPSHQSWPGVEILFAGWEMTLMNEAFSGPFSPTSRWFFYGAGSIKKCVTDEFWKSGIRITTGRVGQCGPRRGIYLRANYRWIEGHLPNVALYSPRKTNSRSDVSARLLSDDGRFVVTGHGGQRMVAERLHHHDVNIIAYDSACDPGGG